MAHVLRVLTRFGPSWALSAELAIDPTLAHPPRFGQILRKLNSYDMIWFIVHVIDRNNIIACNLRCTSGEYLLDVQLGEYQSSIECIVRLLHDQITCNGPPASTRAFHVGKNLEPISS
jgi:hypothetical protein